MRVRPCCLVHPQTGALWIREWCFWLRIQNLSWLWNKTWRFFYTWNRKSAGAAVGSNVSHVGLVSLWLCWPFPLLLQPSCPHSGQGEGVKGWHKLSPAKQKHSQSFQQTLVNISLARVTWPPSAARGCWERKNLTSSPLCSWEERNAESGCQ